MRHDTSAQDKGRPLTGRMVLAMLLAFFGVVIGVNIVMVRLASSTFSGIGDKNAYLAGISHNRTLAAARVQPAVEIAHPDVVPIGLRMAQQAEQLGQVRSSFQRRAEKRGIRAGTGNTGCEPL